MTEQAATPTTTETQATEQTSTNTVVVQTGQPQVDNTVQTEQLPDGTEVTQQSNTDIPASSDAYAVQIDGFDFDAFKESNAETLKGFHDAGMTNKQVAAVVQAFDQYTQVNIDALQQEWGGDYQANLNLANQAIKALGFTPEQIDSPTGFIRLAAAIGKQIQEDLPPSNTQQNGAETIEQLMLSEAYSNASHPDHKSVAQRVNAWYAKQYVD